MVKLWDWGVEFSNWLSNVRWDCHYLWVDALWLWQFRYGRPRMQIRVAGVDPVTGNWTEAAVGWVRFHEEAEAHLEWARQIRPLWIDRYELHSQDGLCRYQAPLRPPTIPRGWHSLEAWGWLHEYDTWFQVPMGTAWRTHNGHYTVHWTNQIRKILVRRLGRRKSRV